MLHPKARAVAAVVLTFLLLASVFALQGCGTASSDTTLDEPVATEPETPPAEEPPAEETTSRPAPGSEPLHTSDVKLTGNEVVVISTEKGDIRIGLFAKDAPNTAASFVELARGGYYDGIRFHRVVRDPQPFVVQGGDPQTRVLSADQVKEVVERSRIGQAWPEDPPLGAGNPGWRLKAEFNQRRHERGTVAMARMEGNNDSAGSQFYICLAPLQGLDGQYTVFGQVVEGMEVVDAIEVGDVMTSVKVTGE